MDENYVGRILENISSSEFRFVSDEYYRGMYIQWEWKEYKGIGLITEKKAENRYFSDPFAIKYVDKDEQLNEGATYIYSVKYIGVLDEGGNLSELEIPAVPGTKVSYAEDALVSKVYDIMPHKDSIAVGFLLSCKNCIVNLQPDKCFNPHMIILGKTGSGKTYFAKNFIQKLINYKRIIFSPTKEYNDCLTLPDGKAAPVIRAQDIVFPFSLDLMSKIWNLNRSEEKVLSQIEFDSKSVFDCEKTISAIENFFKPRQIEFYRTVENIPAAAQNLISKVKKLNLKFSENISCVTSIRDTCVVDMSGSPYRLQECILYHYISDIIKTQRDLPEQSRVKTIILLEEAHNFIPSIGNPICKYPIVNLAREGRKYGISLCMITQRPRYFDQTALSQSGNKFLFSMSHPDDVHSVLEDAFYYTKDMENRLKTLKRGQCIINGDAVRAPIPFKVEFCDKKSAPIAANDSR